MQSSNLCRVSTKKKIDFKIYFFFLFFVMAAIGIYVPELAIIVSVLIVGNAFIYTNHTAGIIMTIMAIFLTDIVSFNYLWDKIKIPLSSLIITQIFVVLVPRLLDSVKFIDKYFKTLFTSIIVFFVWAVLSSLWSHAENPITALSFLLASVFSFIIITLLIDNEKKMNMVFLYLIVIGIFIGTILVSSKWYVFNMEIKDYTGIMISISSIRNMNRPGGFAQPNTASFVMNFILFVTIAQMYGAGLLKKTFLSLVAIFFIVCNLFTGSKTGIIALFLGMLIFILITPALAKFRIRLFIALTSIISIVLLFLGDTVIMRFQTLITKGIYSGTKNSRIDYWLTGFEKFLDSFGLGLGAGGVVQYLPFPSAHSFYLSALFDLGVIGILLLLIILIFLALYVRRGFKNSNNSNMLNRACCIIAGIVSVALQAIVEGDYFVVYYWLILAISIVVIKTMHKTETGY